MKENGKEEKLRFKEFIEWYKDFDKNYRLKVNTPSKRIKCMILFLKEYLFSMKICFLFWSLIVFLGTIFLIYFRLSVVFTYFLLFLSVGDTTRRFFLTKRGIKIIEEILNSL